MTPAERALDALCEECRVYLHWKHGTFDVGTYSDHHDVMKRNALYCGDIPILYAASYNMLHRIAVALNAFPAGARARLELMKHTEPYVWGEINRITQPIEKWYEADRLVAECEALQRGEGV